MKRSALKVPKTTASLSLTPAESVLAVHMASMQGLTYDATHRLLYHRPLPTHTTPRNILTSARVLIHRLRGKLKPYGIEILSHRGVGWYVTPDDQVALRRLLVGEEISPQSTKIPTAETVPGLSIRDRVRRSVVGDAPSLATEREAAPCPG